MLLMNAKYIQNVSKRGHMKLAIIGSRKLKIDDISKYLPYSAEEISEIVSGGAFGVDRSAGEYAKRNKIKLTEFLPDYKRYGRAAPIKRNELIASYADEAVAIWDGKSKGTLHTVRLFCSLNKKVTLINCGAEKEI